MANTALALPTYTITDIGLVVSDINIKGQVAGQGVNPQGKIRAYRYTDGVGWEDLGVAPGLVSADYSTAKGINDRGQVVGRSSNKSFRYTDGVGMENLSDFHCTDFLDTCIGDATEINNSGQVIGWWYSNETLSRRTVRFTDGLAKEIYGLISPLETHSMGMDINDAGQSVGYNIQYVKYCTGCRISELQHAFRITDGVGGIFSVPLAAALLCLIKTIHPAIASAQHMASIQPGK